ncbi:MAG: IS30 family transposase [Polaromonas sp.]|nr:IS30 family transposase [Polaromonas sp.]
MNYTHLSREERYQICLMRRQGHNCTQIALELGRHRSSIARELKRNASLRGYKANAADAMADARQSRRRNAKQFTERHWATAEALIRQEVSPEQITHRLMFEQGFRISCETIYQRILRDKQAQGDLAQHLRCQKPRRKRYGSGRERRGVIKGRVCIEQRPKVVDQKSRIGDIEGDTMMGKNHQGAIVTLVDRKSRYTFARQVNFKKSDLVGQAVIDLLRPHKNRCQTITFDNGKEFADHAFIGKCLDAKVYFAHPYCSWERGLNENTNGLLRQYFPKTMSLRDVSQIDVDDAVYKLNHRPRKCLGYRTPHEVFYNLPPEPITLRFGALCT